MKTLRNENDVQKAAELFALIEQRKENEKREKALKEYFKDFGAPILRVGNYLLTTKECQTSSIDKAALLRDKGESFVTQYTKVTEYTKLDVTLDVSAADSVIIRQFTDAAQKQVRQ